MVQRIQRYLNDLTFGFSGRRSLASGGGQGLKDHKVPMREEREQALKEDESQAPWFRMKMRLMKRIIDNRCQLETGQRGDVLGGRDVADADQLSVKIEIPPNSHNNHTT